MGRTVGEAKLAKRDPNTVMKDLDFQRKIILGPVKRELFYEYDLSFLLSVSIKVVNFTIFRSSLSAKQTHLDRSHFSIFEVNTMYCSVLSYSSFYA